MVVDAADAADIAAAAKVPMHIIWTHISRLRNIDLVRLSVFEGSRK